MKDALAIIRKELSELSTDWQSFYGTFVQGAIVVLLCGIFVPSRSTQIWASPKDVIMLYAIFPSIVAALFAADSFAGERERNTLETLLATPISDGAIYLGKAFAALGISVACSLVALLAAVVTTYIKGDDPVPVVGGLGFATIIVGAVIFGLNTTALATAISSRARVARSAQQISSILSLVLSVVFLWLTSFVHLKSAWLEMAAAEGLLLIIGVTSLALGLRAFNRHRLFG